mmetsp:Transcript_80333/g.215327  ORF Transcript_80333/g.215327 Transcript_80333/m.215327 type:complete len:101 (+) Transcript_80333:562-864(+)
MLPSSLQRANVQCFGIQCEFLLTVTDDDRIIESITHPVKTNLKVFADLRTWVYTFIRSSRTFNAFVLRNMFRVSECGVCCSIFRRCADVRRKSGCWSFSL